MQMQVVLHILFIQENPNSTNFGAVRDKEEDIKHDGPTNETVHKSISFICLFIWLMKISYNLFHATSTNIVFHCCTKRTYYSMYMFTSGWKYTNYFSLSLTLFDILNAIKIAEYTYIIIHVVL